MALIVVCAVSFAAIASGSEAWSGALFSITFFTMVCSLLGVALTRGMQRTYWCGFATLGWSYLVLMYAPYLNVKVGSFLCAPSLFPYIADALHAAPDVAGGLQSIPGAPIAAVATGGAFGGVGGGAGGMASVDLPAFIRIGVAMEALLWAYLGGWVACYFAASRGREADRVVAPPPAAEAP